MKTRRRSMPLPEYQGRKSQSDQHQPKMKGCRAEIVRDDKGVVKDNPRPTLFARSLFPTLRPGAAAQKYLSTWNPTTKEWDVMVLKDMNVG